MKRAMIVPVLLFGVMVILLSPESWPVLAQGDEGHEPSEEQGDQYAMYRGAAIYAEFCQACHGVQGEGRGDGPAFRAIEYDPETAREIVADGRDSDAGDGVAMPPYAQLSGGLLTGRQIDDLMAYMATWGTGQTPPLPEPHLSAAVESVLNHPGDLSVGAEIYATSCYGCHGREGRGRVPPNFPPLTVTANVLAPVRDGTDSPYMPAFDVAQGGPLDDRDLENLDAYLLSWTLEAPVEGPSSEGYGTLIILMGIAAILFVGGAYVAREQRTE